jgi:DNA-binding transcriptional LysR family regulator
VTTQVKALERQSGRELFARLPRGVTPTPYAHDLAARIAGPLDALLAATGQGPAESGPPAPVHLAGPAELLCLRVLPALAPLVAEGLRLRVTPGLTDPLLDEVRTTWSWPPPARAAVRCSPPRWPTRSSCWSPRRCGRTASAAG